MGMWERDRIVRRGRGKIRRGRIRMGNLCFCILYFGIWFLENEFGKGNGRIEKGIELRRGRVKEGKKGYGIGEFGNGKEGSRKGMVWKYGKEGSRKGMWMEGGWDGMGWLCVLLFIENFLLVIYGKSFSKSSKYNFSIFNSQACTIQKRAALKKPLKKFHIYASNRYPIMFIIG